MSDIKRRRMTIRTRRAITGYLFILPFILGFLVFMVRPLLNSFFMSFCDVNPNGLTMEWTGTANYKYALTADPEYNRLLVEEVSRMFINTLATLVLSFVVAVILNGKFKGRTLARAIFFLPVIFSAGVLLGLDSNMLGVEAQNTLMSGISDAVAESGGVNLTDTLKAMLQASGIGTRAFQVVFDIIDSVYDIVIASGIQIIVFLSGMQNIPASLYEAAHVEGCSGWESFWKITFPMVSPLLLVNTIYTIIDFFTKSNNRVMEKISEVMYANYKFGVASAMSWIYFGVSILMIGVASLIISLGVKNVE
ncbi:MAG: sugar ABC transporter permease [Clostridia bacterium]|nr:sugar ABC transporter permease [Clostridia bacterium]